jgi:MerR family transcriptional regulator, light-induced transcriptional regulator
LTDQDAVSPGHTYRIGTVSRLTGVPADTLRVWERRYSVVAPVRSDSGTRLYGPDDVSRLTLIKRLVDRGDAISSVANLDLEQLRERIRGTDLPDQPSRPKRPCRLMVIGASLAERLRREAPPPEDIDLVGLYDSEAAFLQAGRPPITPDVAILEFPTIQGDQVREIGALAARCGAHRTILLYNFTSRATIDRLDARRLIPKRAPASLQELRDWCLGGLAAHPAETSEDADIDLCVPVRPRRFGDPDLVRIAAASPSIRCECPRHLADLVSALNAFESYSAECEDRSAEDAALHAYLHAATARARALMETALARVVAAEGILLAVPDGEI